MNCLIGLPKSKSLMRLFFLIFLMAVIGSYIFTRCTHHRFSTDNTGYPIIASSLDTLYIPINFEPSNDTIRSLPDSLTQVYLATASKGLHYFPLDSSLSYKGYDLGLLSLNATTQGRLIRFEPSYNDYSAIYLFLDPMLPNQCQAVEIAFSMWDEGVQGTGSSFLIQNSQPTQLYIRQYWVNYYGSNAEAVVATDAIQHYLHSKNNWIDTPMNHTQRQIWRTIFEQKERQH